MSDTYVAPSDNAAPAATELVTDLSHVVPLVVKESKEGYKTTEFWLAVATAVLVNINVVPLPDKFQGWATAGLAAVYALSRGLAKSGIPEEVPTS